MTDSFNPGNRLIVALDVATRRRADDLINRLGDAVSWLKIGLELFVAEGPSIVRHYIQQNYRIMLDLKLHDIPATVEQASRRVANLGAELLTVHAGGGRAMLEAAVRGAESTSQLRILAVTALTSLDQSDLAEVGIAATMDDLVLGRARLAVTAGCHGVVASPREATRLRAAIPDRFLLVTPGVRPRGSHADDQKRVMTPEQARAAGADLIVCGRPIRDATDPAASARAIIAELAASK
ncbi:MAG: orotidine-5'-phosphate decarboxylase [Proteobacteria bacterium]|nr:orotidine-5'-phosphate decarboxylase [Pseudomonadota bacterium]